MDYLDQTKPSEDQLKIFHKQKEAQELVEKIQKKNNLEVMIYGEEAFKHPKGNNLELAYPIVLPAFTKGLKGTPDELKLKYLEDNEFANLKGEELKEAISKFKK